MSATPERTPESHYREWLREIACAPDHEAACRREDAVLAFMLQRDKHYAELEQAVKKYGRHVPGCGVHAGLVGPCTCGWDGFQGRGKKCGTCGEPKVSGHVCPPNAWHGEAL